MSSPETSDTVDFHRDVPTTAEDVRFLRKARDSGSRNLLPELDRLARAVRSLRLAPRTSTAEGWRPFEL